MAFGLSSDTLVFAQPGCYARGLQTVRQETENGRRAEFAVCGTLEEAAAYARKKGIRRLLAVGEQVKEVKVCGNCGSR